LRFCIRDVDENGDVVAGILCCRHCAGRWKADGMRFVVVKGRNTGRKDEKFIVVYDEAQLRVVTIGVDGVGDFGMEFDIILVNAKTVSAAEVGLHRCREHD
jgi:hypothetical protein